MMFTKKNTPPKLQRTLDGVRKEKNTFPLVKKQKSNTFFSKRKTFSLSFLIVMILLGSISMYFSDNIKGATYGWIQSSWIGGVTTNIATHTNNQENWTEFASKDSNIQADANGVTITGTNNSWVTTTDGDFIAGERNGMYVSGGTLHTQKPPGTACTEDKECIGCNCLSGSCVGGGCGSSYDAQDNCYGSVIIGTQCWMAKNMRYLPSVTHAGDGSDAAPKYYIWGYNGTDVESAKAFTISGVNIWKTEGVLYNWDAAMDGSTTEGAKGICPVGWHIPTDAEQNILDQYLKDTLATCNASRSGHDCSSAGTKLQVGGSSGMNIRLTGYKHEAPSFDQRGLYGMLWSSSSSGLTSAWIRRFDLGAASIFRGLSWQIYGFGVRCIKN